MLENHVIMGKIKLAWVCLIARGHPKNLSVMSRWISQKLDIFL